MSETTNLQELASDIVTSFVGNNQVPTAELPKMIQGVYTALTRCEASKTSNSEVTVKPAVPVGKSVFSDYIICLEDGQKYKSLKRHLRAKYDLSPDAYRQKWSLPSTYPMVAPEYAKTRSALARKIGLGRRRKIG